MPSSKAGIVMLSLKEAQLIADGAIQMAEEIGVKVCVTVCDAGGRFVLINRMDGAPWAAVYGSKGKAIGSACFNISTGRLKGRTGGNHARVVQFEGQHMVLDQGGVAIFRDGIGVGACGVDGGTGVQDEACARTGITKFTSAPTPKPAHVAGAAHR